MAIRAISHCAAVPALRLVALAMCVLQAVIVAPLLAHMLGSRLDVRAGRVLLVVVLSCALAIASA